MDPAYQSGCNCVKDCKCGDDYICCSQKGNERVFGLCIKKENGCDTNTGLAKVKGNVVMQNNKEVLNSSGNSEGYSSDDNCDCNNWKNAMLVLCFIVIILFIGLICLKIKL